MGRPEKPPEERALGRLFTFPPELWAQVEAKVPPMKRLRFIQEAVREKLATGGGDA